MASLVAPRSSSLLSPAIADVPPPTQAGVRTCRRLYVPQVGQAACGSFGLRQFGQLTSVGAAVFHWARRERVLLRDIFRLGTATSALLSVFYSRSETSNWRSAAHRGSTFSPCP